jgi:peroxiredoxin
VLKSPIAPGSALPPFSLPDAEGRTHSRDDVQGAQWLVISLYRGRW